MSTSVTKRIRITLDFEMPAEDKAWAAEALRESLVKNGATNIKVAVWELASYAEDKKKEQP